MIQLDAKGYKIADRVMHELDPGSNRLSIYTAVKEVIAEGCPSDGELESCSKVCGSLAISLCQKIDEAIPVNISPDANSNTVIAKPKRDRRHYFAY